MPGKVNTEKLRELMKQQGISGAQMARDLYMTRSGIHFILHKGETSDATAQSIADYLGCWLCDIYQPRERKKVAYRPDKFTGFFKKFLELCNANGVRIEDVAKATGYAKQTFYSYGEREESISFKFLCKVADYFGVTPTVFLNAMKEGEGNG